MPDQYGLFDNLPPQPTVAGRLETAKLALEKGVIDPAQARALVDPTAPFIPGSPTSQAAAESVRPRISALQQRVLTTLQAAGDRGLTDDEMQVRLGMNPSTQRPRRVELAEKKLIARTGERRATRTGAKAAVWRAR